MELLIPTGSAEGTGDRAAGSSLLAEIVQGAPVPLWVIGPTGTVVIANRAAVSFLGYRTNQDVVGGPSHDLLHRHRLDGSDYPAEDCPIVCSTGSGGASSEWFLTREGDPRRVQWSTHAVDTAGTTLLTFSPAASEAGSPGVEPSLRLVPPPSSPFRSREAVRSALYTAMRKRFQDPAFSAADLAAEAHLSVRSLQSLFREVDRSPAAEIRRLRLDHARAMLARGHSVRAACVGSGYLDPDSFSRAFRRHFGCSPSEVRGYGPFDHAA